VLRRAYGPTIERPHEIYDRGRLHIDYDTYESRSMANPHPRTTRVSSYSSSSCNIRTVYLAAPKILDLVWDRMSMSNRGRSTSIFAACANAWNATTPIHTYFDVRGVGYKFNPDALENSILFPLISLALLALVVVSGLLFFHLLPLIHRPSLPWYGAAVLAVIAIGGIIGFGIRLQHRLSALTAFLSSASERTNRLRYHLERR
jgi:hypothetical protein